MHNGQYRAMYTVQWKGGGSCIPHYLLENSEPLPICVDLRTVIPQIAYVLYLPQRGGSHSSTVQALFGRRSRYVELKRASYSATPYTSLVF